MTNMSKAWNCLQASMVISSIVLVLTLSSVTSPCAEVLVYQNNVGIRMVRPDGTEVCQLTYSDKRGFFGGRGKWSPDGRYFAYTCSEKDSDYPSVRIIQCDGKKDLLIGEGDLIGWSSRSDYVLYSDHTSKRVDSGWTGRKSIALSLYNLKQSAHVKVSDKVLSYRDQPPLISPDGNYVIYPLYSGPKHPRCWELYTVEGGKKSIAVQDRPGRDVPRVLCWLRDCSGFLLKRGLKLRSSHVGGIDYEILLVKGTEGGQNERPILTTRRLDRLEVISLSPQWKKVAYVAGKKGLRIFDLETLSDTKVADGDFRYLRDFLAWSMDGKQIAFATDHVSVVNADGTGLRTIVTPENCGKIDQIFWSPDGCYIAYRLTIVSAEQSERGWFEEERRAEVHLMNISTGKDKVLVDDGGFGGWSRSGKHIAYQKRLGYGKRFPSKSEVYVADGTGSKSLLIGEGLLVEDSWSPQ